MHVFDHHGVTNVANGGILLRLVRTCSALGGTQDERMANITAELKSWFDHHIVSSRMPPLSIHN